MAYEFTTPARAITCHLLSATTLLHTLSRARMLQQMGVVMYREWLEAGSCVYLGSICGWAFKCVCRGEHDNRCVKAASRYDSCSLYLSSPDVFWMAQLLFFSSKINESYCFLYNVVEKFSIDLLAHVELEPGVC